MVTNVTDLSCGLLPEIAWKMAEFCGFLTPVRVDSGRVAAQRATCPLTVAQLHHRNRP
jgi:hypothetical protein